MYDKKQLNVDLSNIILCFGERKSHGFYTRMEFTHTDSKLVFIYDYGRGVYIEKNYIQQSLENLLPSEGLGLIILKLAMMADEI